MSIERIRTLARGEEGYPSRFLDLEDPPQRLWISGSLPRAPAVAIVGTRRADGPAMDFTERLARELVSSGVSIVSGGAVGIDAAAHRGALAGGGHTIVVQAAALADPYPRTNRKLFERVIDDGGGWLSETPRGMPAQPHRFLARNRLIAALADAVVVVQAPARSGALSTARFARALSRPLFAVPAAPWDPRSAGVLALLVDLAKVCRGVADLRASLGMAAAQTELFDEEPELGDDAHRVLDSLSSMPSHVDDLVRASALSPARVQAALVELSLEGLARQELGSWRSVRR